MALLMEKGSQPQTESERADLDAIAALKESSAIELKALYRAAKASFSVNLLSESASHCENGLKHDPGNEELKKLLRQIELKKMEHQQREAQVSKAIAEAKDLVSAIESRGMKLGKAMYRELTGLRKPVLDKNNMLHWPVLLLYAEVMSSDFIEDFCETDMLSAHLGVMFSDSCPPLSWDQEHNYTRDAIELYYKAGSGASLSKTEILRCLLEGTPASNVESINDKQKDANENSIGSSSAGKGFSKWIKVNERRTLYDVLKEPNFIVPGIPVFYVVSKRSSFYKEFKAGNWAPLGSSIVSRPRRRVSSTSIAIPTFALLYSMDEVVVDLAVTIKAIGHQWYRTYKYSDYNSSDEQSL